MSEWDVRPSKKACRTRNPIRQIVDSIAKAGTKCDKELIPLSLGDPTVYGNLRAPDCLVEAVVDAARSFKSNGYTHSAGEPSARDAVANYYTSVETPLSRDDVIIASGGSGALDLAITALVNEGDDILVPRPGFPLYQVIAESNGGRVIEYPLLPEHNWEVDTQAMDRLVTPRTRAIVVNNPSNPCGSLFSDENLLAILAVASKHRVPVITDEIYGSMTFSGHTFTPIAILAAKSGCGVPVLTIGGLAKMFVVPGWRVGWILIHDPTGVLRDLRQGLLNLSQLVLGATTLVQAALPKVLVRRSPSKFGASGGEVEPAGASSVHPDDTELRMQEFERTYVGALEQAARFASKKLGTIPGLSIIEPRGAMYMMVQVHPEMFEGIADDRQFAGLLLQEEAVFVLPGTCFGAPNFFRVVFTAPEGKLAEAFDRIDAFCRSHLLEDAGTPKKKAKLTAGAASPTTSGKAASAVPSTRKFSVQP